MKTHNALELALTVRWKVSPCPDEKECWCAIIEPENEMLDEQGERLLIVEAGKLAREYAEHIVIAHNMLIVN